MPVHNQFMQDAKGALSPGALRIAGPVIPIEVHVPPQIAQVMTNQGQPIPLAGTGMALIDTGASITCLHEPILLRLQLNPISIALFGTAHGQVQQSIYPARIVFPIWGGLTIDFSGVAGAYLGDLRQYLPKGKEK